jgi:phosphoserine phosphatase
VLLTSSSSYLSEAVAATALARRLAVQPLRGGRRTGRYTAGPAGPLCYGPGKVEVARAFAQARGVSLAQCAFYSDSASDLPMLEAVGRPVAVNPDPRLRRVALGAGGRSRTGRAGGPARGGVVSAADQDDDRAGGKVREQL